MSELRKLKSRRMTNLYNLASARLAKLYNRLSSSGAKKRADEAVRRSEDLHRDLSRLYKLVMRDEALLQDYTKAVCSWYCQLYTDFERIPQIRSGCRRQRLAS